MFAGLLEAAVTEGAQKVTMLRNTQTLVVDGLLDWRASANLSSSRAEEAVTETGSQLGREKDV